MPESRGCRQKFRTRRGVVCEPSVVNSCRISDEERQQAQRARVIECQVAGPADVQAVAPADRTQSGPDLESQPQVCSVSARSGAQLPNAVVTVQANFRTPAIRRQLRRSPAGPVDAADLQSARSDGTTGSLSLGSFSRPPCGHRGSRELLHRCRTGPCTAKWAGSTPRRTAPLTAAGVAVWLSHCVMPSYGHAPGVVVNEYM